ncbi:MAG: PTS transporter subunit IIC [Candidatus Hydromicrobium sp.]|nr:PTS transporter subunit IIC [Candidatus Hydromicrobium sp.]
MSNTYGVINYIIELGPVILIPATLLIISLIITRKPLKNLKNCAFILIGLVSLSVLLTLFVNFFGSITNTILINSSKKFEIIDTGWLVSKAVILNSPIILQIIIAIVILNLIMLSLRFTRTINIDFWNYWSFLLVGSIIFAITEIKWIGILIAMIVAAITLVLSDIYATYIESYFGLKGISTPQAQIICWAPVSHLINVIFNKIPFIRRVHVFYEEIQYKLGVVSEPMIMGFILGFIIGAITRYKNFYLNLGPNLLYALLSGLTLSIIMILLPRSVNLLLKGLVPTINDIKSFISRRITKRELYIGLDPIVLVGQPSIIMLSVIIIPLTVYISTILPGNAVLPKADLIMIPFILIWVIAPSKGDIFRSLISAVIIIPIILWITTNMGYLFTNFFLKYNMELVEGYKRLSSIGGSSNIFFWILLKIIEPIFNLFL